MEGSSYSGSSSFKYIDPLITRGSGELLVISPYISMHYARLLVSAGRRRKVRIITSASSAQAAREISGNSTRRAWAAIKAALALTAAAAVSAYLGIAALLWITALPAAVSWLFAVHRLKNRKRSNVSVRIPGRFVHEKLYLSDDLAIVGSANLTYGGTHRNVEHIELIRDPDRIDRFVEHFNRMWDSS